MNYGRRYVPVASRERQHRMRMKSTARRSDLTFEYTKEKTVLLIDMVFQNEKNKEKKREENIYK